MPQLRPMWTRAQIAKPRPKAKRTSPTAARAGSVATLWPWKTPRRTSRITRTRITSLIRASGDQGRGHASWRRRPPASTARTPPRRRRRRARPVSPSDSAAVLELAIVFSLVVVPQRLGDQPVGGDRPLLEAGDAHLLTCLCARAGEGPVVLDEVVFEDEVVHEDLDVGKGGDERLRPRWFFPGVLSVDGNLSPRDIVGGHASGVMAAPRLGIGACRLLDLLPVFAHRPA